MSSSKAALGISIAALAVASIALGGLAYAYVQVTQVVNSYSGPDNRQSSNPNSNAYQTNTCTNCGSNPQGNASSITTVVSGTTTTLQQCQGTGGLTPNVTTATTFGGSTCYLLPNQTLTLKFAVGANGLSASGQVAASSPVDVKILDMSTGSTIFSKSGSTSVSLSSQPLNNGHTYEVDIINNQSQNNSVTGNITVSG